jgi:hypothetical protein
VYSLVSAPVLGFDLTRIEGGAGVADVLTRALALGPDDLAVLADHRLDDGQRAELWAEVEIATTVQPTVRDVAGLSKATPAGTHADKRASAALGLLQRAPLGTVDGLLQCVRYDVLDWTWERADGTKASGSAAIPPGQRSSEPTPAPAKLQSETASQATSVICDALVAGYLRQELDAPVRRRLAAGWVSASRRLPEHPVTLGPTGPSMRALIDRVATLSQQGAGDPLGFVGGAPRRSGARRGGRAVLTGSGSGDQRYSGDRTGRRGVEPAQRCGAGPGGPRPGRCGHGAPSAGPGAGHPGAVRARLLGRVQKPITPYLAF